MGLNGKLVLVGAGKMGGAMLEGWLAGGLPAADVIVQDPAPPPEIADLLAKHGISQVTELTAAGLDAPPAVILMAVKPQIMDDVFPAVAPLAGPDTVCFGARITEGTPNRVKLAMNLAQMAADATDQIAGGGSHLVVAEALGLPF